MKLILLSVLILLGTSVGQAAYSPESKSLIESSPSYDLGLLSELSRGTTDQNLAWQLTDEGAPAKAVVEVASSLEIYRGDSCEIARQAYLRCLAMGNDFCWYRCLKPREEKNQERPRR